MGNVFLIPDLEIIRSNLKLLGYRFPNVRAKYIFLAQQHKDNIREIINKYKNTAFVI